MNVKRLTLAVATGAVLTVGGGSSAWAWTWASSSNPIVMIGGKGYGTATGVTEGTLKSTLADTKAEGERVYVDLYGYYYQGTTLKYIAAESGRRTDGGSSYAAMADKKFYPLYGTTLGIYNYGASGFSVGPVWP